MFSTADAHAARDELACRAHIQNICDVFGISDADVDLTEDGIEASVRALPSEYQLKFVRKHQGVLHPTCSLTRVRVIKFPLIRTVDHVGLALDALILLAVAGLVVAAVMYGVKYVFK